MVRQEAQVGWVVRARSGFYEVVDNNLRRRCRLRGKLKRGKRDLAQPIVVGDQVTFTPVGDGEGIIESRLERRSTFARARMDKPSQVMVANLDQVILVFALTRPALDRMVLDSFLAALESLDLEICLCINKCDLVPLRRVWRMTQTYRDLGYPLLYTSTVTGLGLSRFQRTLQDQVSAIAGPSGVGKSSLLNTIQPGLRLHTGPLSALGEGRHITNEVRLLPLEIGGFVADTPGIRSMHLLEVAPEELPACFPEITEQGAECRFQNCSHIREPGCAVQVAVRDGIIDPLRYDNYCQLRLDLEAQARF